MTDVRRQGRVFNHGRLAGRLMELSDGSYRFVYDPSYLSDPSAESISLSLPRQPQPFESATLFSFFYGLLSEGPTRALQCRTLRIDEDDDFGLLLATGRDTIGSVSIEEAGEPDVTR